MQEKYILNQAKRGKSINEKKGKSYHWVEGNFAKGYRVKEKKFIGYFVIKQQDGKRGLIGGRNTRSIFQ